jgi:hypothetical protein
VAIGATSVAALLAVLERPVTWVLGLVGFLVRGGWLIVLAPIVVLPTAVGIANVVAPLVEDIAFGRRTDEVITAGAIALSVALVWLIGGGLLAAAAEVECVRCLTLVPFVVALAWSGFRLTSVGYRELTVPSDVGIPILYRILGGAPDAIMAMLLTWLFAEIAGGLAARTVILEATQVRDALREALRDLRQRPWRLGALASLSAAVLLAVIGVTGLATSTTWDGLRAALGEGDVSIGAAALLVLFVGLFAAGLVILGLVTAWRSAVWTVIAVQGVPSSAGTFGGGPDTRSGD